MQFTKIRCTKEGDVELQTKIQLDGGAGEARTFTCSQPPLPELPAALQAFKPFVLSLVPIRDDEKKDEDGNVVGKVTDDLRVTTLSLDEEAKTKKLGLIVTAVLPIEDANGRPLVLNTPRMREWEDDGSDQPKGTFGEDVTKLIDAAQEAANRYYRGERGQVEMFKTKETTAAPETTNGTQPGEKAAPKVRRRRMKHIPEIGMVEVPGEPPTDAQIRKQLQISGLDVPEAAIAAWTSSERDEAMQWAQQPDGIATPEFIRKAASLDAWSDRAPVRIGDNQRQEIAAAIEAAD